MKIHPKLTMNFEMWFRVNETEARALHALTLYGTDVFLKMFYERLGSSLEPHEAGLRTLFEAIKEQLPPILTKVGELEDEAKTLQE